MRIALFHAELERDGPGLLLRDILSGDDPQIEAGLRILEAADADVLLLAGFDHDLNGVALAAFADRLGGYPHRFAPPPNRGRPSHVDLDGDGKTGGPGDAFGYAEFRGQGGLALLSRLPVDVAGVRDFTSFRWRALPDHLALPETLAQHPLSTTGHWDVPLITPEGQRLHILAWHATPPVFDGPEDRNGRRNHDEAAFWTNYLDGKLDRAPPGTFVLAGVANLDPLDGDGRPAAMTALLQHAKVQDVAPRSDGGVEAAATDGQINARHRGDPALDTVDWPDHRGRPGNLRVDYVLPSASLDVADAGVFWPLPEALLGGEVVRASRHRLVWVDVVLPESGGERD